MHAYLTWRTSSKGVLQLKLLSSRLTDRSRSRWRWKNSSSGEVRGAAQPRRHCCACSLLSARHVPLAGPSIFGAFINGLWD
ncbi:hypothetical protein K458DRAFT_418030 [Lentithecium fluviatile CBS 122367]|uniref:Uncharacterized protein n=1 Tax=Lentithecium fluviatile CBS 122367 TaxID=1168545 RepID=A0A6G1J1S0_9PLEO|nr:hypothetical protein K458DRAFT_418030 [Lentithecium fluviatile CBS 122367]